MGLKGEIFRLNELKTCGWQKGSNWLKQQIKSKLDNTRLRLIRALEKSLSLLDIEIRDARHAII